jgi:ferredoxin
MSFVVTEKCINCKYTDCVEVCPVDCFYLGPNMLVISPIECISCGLCEDECPINAIKDENDIIDIKHKNQITSLNKKYSEIWPNITMKDTPPKDANEWDEVPNKINFFKP